LRMTFELFSFSIKMKIVLISVYRIPSSIILLLNLLRK